MRLAFLLAAFTLLALPAAAFPDRPVTLIVPFAPGGPTDTTGRLVADGLSQRLGQRFVVENVSGAGSSIGSARVARAAPDGHVLLVNHLALPGSAALQANLPYDTATAFVPVGLINYGPMILIGRRDLPARDVAAAFAWMRAGGERVTLGHAGTGSALHLCGLLIQHRLGTRFTEIGYRGSAPAFQDMLGGRVDVICDISTTGLPQVMAGAARAFAVTTRARLPALPDVPTLAEAGFEGFELVLWNALFAPAGTPRPIIDRLNAALREVLADPAIRERFAAFGSDIFPPAEQTPEAAQARLQAEIVAIRDTVRAMGVQPER
ncbi:tripartite tricarboxylate transporter substrate binding protein BugD [Roseococcus sp. SDR]|uniref:tripartite tricarboxylate transporter substrate-binding protein n=1 Tax=Roseococcus sp. SDR TaxID=2835532 RepID=UPI001BCF0257|nr:tripartite tricarboxylate transporter substrate-binding protein [Roseococcus sp. SDR]MBS7790610.1 tripartite tricarboxylate transporter substrate binding protein BugD [Roseococcus sp. SDR]MBV1845924.1 tripartite tricarboxylate transporter substrate binding protein BugD [Roseococcus sp. SDR]